MSGFVKRLIGQIKDVRKSRTFNKPRINEAPWQNVEKTVVIPAPKRPTAFNPDAPMRLSNKPGRVEGRDPSDDEWIATPLNGMIPMFMGLFVLWGAADKQIRLTPMPNDAEEGPERYMYRSDALHWGDYRRYIRVRKGRHIWWMLRDQREWADPSGAGEPDSY